MQYCLLASTVELNGARRLEASDRAAVQLALPSNSETVAICPADDAMAWAFAIAAGVASVLPVESPPFSAWEIVWAGTGFVERQGELFLARWADARDALLLFDVLSCSAPRDGVRTIVCDAGRGATEELQMRGPCILVLSNAVSRTPYVSRYRRHEARRLASLTAASHDPSISSGKWVPARPRVRSNGADSSRPADSRMDQAFAMDAVNDSSSQSLIVADAETCAQQMIRYLAHHGFLNGMKGDSADIQPSTERATSAKPRPVNTRRLSPSVQRQPRWLDSNVSSSRGPFWCDSNSRHD